MAQEKPESKIGKNMSTFSYSHARFDDFDSVGEVAQEWNLDLRLLDRGGFHGELVQAVTPVGMLARCRFMAGVEQRGGIPPGCRTFGIPLADCSPFYWRGRLLTANHLLMFPRDAELDSRSFEGFHVYPLSVAEPLLQEQAQRLGIGWLEDGGERVVSVSADQMKGIRQIAGETLEALSQPAAELDQDPSVVILQLASMVLDAMNTSSQPQPRPMAEKRHEALTKVLDVIDSPENEVWRVSELCEMTQVSRRTMQYAFEEKFRVSPKQYLQARRLIAVKRQLEYASDDDQVGDIASKNGYWHMGQFAADFRDYFGKLPSEMLGRKS